MTTNAASCLVPVSDLHAHVLTACRLAKLPIQGAVYEGESLHCCSIETTGVAAAATPFEHHRATQDQRILERTPRRMLQACRSGDRACVIGGQRSEPRIVRFCIIRRYCGGCGNGCILGGADARRSLCHPGATGMEHLRVYKEVSPSRDSIET